MKPTGKFLICSYAGSHFYTRGKRYRVFKDKNGREFVKGSDGIYDNISRMVSKFDEDV